MSHTQVVEITEQISKYTGSILAIIGWVSMPLLLFTIVGFLFNARKFKDTDKKYKYAILIPAMNEEGVLGNLLESIERQNYPHELLTVFVVADRCTDRTVEIAKSYGCVVYERNTATPKEQRMSYVLDIAIQNIKRDYGIMAFDGYLGLNADNILKDNYMTEMNKAFDDKEYDYITSCIVEKGKNEGFISSYSTVCFSGLEMNNLQQHRACSFLGLSPFIVGKGYILRNYLLENGWIWKATLLDDQEFSSDSIASGYRGAYVETAKLYDENPEHLSTFLNQRRRWTKGGFSVWYRSFFPLLLGIIWPIRWKKYPNKEKPPKKTIGEKFAAGISKRLSCYKQFVFLFPWCILTLVVLFILPIFMAILSIIYNDVSIILNYGGVALKYYAVVYIMEVCMYILVLIRQRGNMTSDVRKLWKFVLFWPFITLLQLFLGTFYILMPTRWKRIEHTKQVDLDDLNKTAISANKKSPDSI